MTELNGQSQDILRNNIEAMRQLFPEVFNEDQIDFDKLKQVLGKYSDDNLERYNFTWNGKGRALRLSQTPSLGTLRPCQAESQDWDTTENLYIEGDNLEVLKLLQKSYHGKIKMIYIDPPYNTGNDFVYPDDFSDSLVNYKALTGQVDAEGRKLSTNSESSGRYHTDWLNMMYPRLRLARNLLSDEGVIFISIDDNEVDNLKKICNEIFGEGNFLAQVVWERAYSPVNLKKHFSVSHDYIICFAKNIDYCVCHGLPRSIEANERYSNPDNDSRGAWQSSDLSVGPAVQTNIYEIITPNGRSILPPSGRSWVLDSQTFAQYVKDNRIWFGKDGSIAPRIKRFLSEVKQGMTPMTVWKYTEVGHSQDAAQKLKKLFDGKAFFEYPKSIDLIKRLLQLYSDKNSIVLDFFSGSATTAHAVMQLNAEDGGQRRFIMVQLPEPCLENTEAAKAGYKNICEIGKERIRRAGAKIKAEMAERNAQRELDQQPQDLPDLGFKVLKLDTSNLKKWQPDYDHLEDSLFDSISNYVEGRSELDVVYEIMIKMGIELTLPVETHILGGKNVYTMAKGALMICLDNHLTPEVAEGMVTLYREQAPSIWKVVFKDNGFASDSAKVNIKEILKSAGLEEEAFTTI